MTRREDNDARLARIREEKGDIYYVFGHVVAYGMIIVGALAGLGCVGLWLGWFSIR